MPHNPITNLSRNELHGLFALLVLILLLVAIGIYTGSVITADGIPVKEHITMSFLLTYGITAGLCTLLLWVILHTLRQQRTKPSI